MDKNKVALMLLAKKLYRVFIVVVTSNDNTYRS